MYNIIFIYHIKDLVIFDSIVETFVGSLSKCIQSH